MATWLFQGAGGAEQHSCTGLKERMELSVANCSVCELLYVRPFTQIGSARSAVLRQLGELFWLSVQFVHF